MIHSFRNFDNDTYFEMMYYLNYKFIEIIVEKLIEIIVENTSERSENFDYFGNTWFFGLE